MNIKNDLTSKLDEQQNLNKQWNEWDSLDKYSYSHWSQSPLWHISILKIFILYLYVIFKETSNTTRKAFDYNKWTVVVGKVANNMK